MLFDTWSLALLSCSAVTLFFAFVGSLTALRILRYWDSGSDSEIQIRLEGEIWLSSTLMEFGLIVELISVILLVLAADYFSTLLTGAMCATGALTANQYGIPAILSKLLTIFFCALWIILHRLDCSSEKYPLVRLKYILVLLLFPLLTLNAALLLYYLANLEPEIITSCCGVIFSSQTRDGYNLLGTFENSLLMTIYGAVICLIGASSVLLLAVDQQKKRFSPLLLGMQTCGWVTFYPLSLVVITVIVSPYVYAMPHHRCPFDLLQAHYYWIGYPLYFFLHVAVVAGLTPAAVSLVSWQEKELALQAASYRKRSLWGSLVSLTAFLLIAAYHPARYLLTGGE
ncbi:MAG: hypothetical protein HKP41_01225 [Desulfobacterales bacterium]|nr:hypothetical protein [Desulfobacterales bacterium]